MALTTMYNGQVNSPQTALNGAINSSVTSITVVDGTILPIAPMPLVISEGTKEPETVLMTNKVGNVLTVTRAFQGVAQSWGSGASIGRNFTAYDYNTLVENATTINNDLDAHKAKSATQDELGHIKLSDIPTPTKASIGLGNVDNLKQMPISNGVLENYREKLNVTTGEIDLSLSNTFTQAISTDTTYSITNVIDLQAHSFTLVLTQDVTPKVLTFPASVKWQGGEIPDMSTASKTYVLTFLSIDGGTTWLGMFGGAF